MKMESVVAEQNRRARSRSFWSLLPWIVLAIGIPASVLLSGIVQDSIERVARLRFEREANDANGIIEGRLRSYADVMYALRALFSTETYVDRLKFHRYVESLDLVHRYPGFDSLNYAAYVRGKDKKAFENSVRRDTSLDPRGYPGFAIKPPGERPEYYVVVYLEPMKGYEFAFGLDIAMNPAASNPERIHVALGAGRDSGALTASGQPLRIKQAKEAIYLAMRLAIYQVGRPIETIEQRRAAYIGSVGAGFNLENLMRGILMEGNPGSEVGGTVSAEMLRYVRVRLYDVGPSGRGVAPAPESRRLLFDSYQLREPPSASAARDPGSEFRHVVAVEIGGRTWDFEYSAERNAVISRLDRILRWWVLAGGVLFSLLLFGVLYALASSRSRAVAIANDITKDLRESQEQLQALSRRLVEVQELERRRLSSELHDRVGQNLTALSINLDILKARVAASADEEVASRLDDSQHLLGATADTIDNVMSELRPPMLDDYGLHAALNWHAREFSRRTGVAVGLRGDEAGARPQPEIEITLFRIAQEALNNVAKHAHAERVTIVLEFRDIECIMSVADDGRGFAAARSAGASKRQGVGMVTMRERAQAVGGTFEVRAAPGGGTQIIVRVPR
jgi:signal transduction histidine kinase